MKPLKLTISTGDLTKPLDTDAGILYLLEMELEDRTLVKIGVTQRTRVEDRICEILVSIWKRYRVFPKCVAKRYRTVDKVYEKEKYLHTVFSSDRYATKFVFSGSTEMFTTSLTDVVQAYDEITN